MPNSEKEYNVYLFDQISLLERLKNADRDGGYEKMKEQIA